MTNEPPKKRPSYLVRAERRSAQIPPPPLPSFPSTSSQPIQPAPGPVQNAVSEPAPLDEGAPLEMTVAGVVVSVTSEDYVYQTPQQIHRWATLLGEAKRELLTAEGKFQSWRSRAMMTYLQSNTKIAEWRLRAAIDGMPTFIDYRTALALAERNVIVLDALLTTLLNQK